jgi:hypothetical protein
MIDEDYDYQPHPVFETAKAEQVLAHIEANPEAHNQGTWWQEFKGCGTAGCFAGWGVHLNIEGIQPLFDQLGNAQSFYVPGSNTPILFEDAGMEVLGLTSERAEVLFDGYNSLEDLKLIVKCYANDTGGDSLPFDDGYYRCDGCNHLHPRPEDSPVPDACPDAPAI